MIVFSVINITEDLVVPFRLSFWPSLTFSSLLFFFMLPLFIQLFSLSLFQGATIKRDESTGAIVVARIMRGGAADKSGKNNLKTELMNNEIVSIIYYIGMCEAYSPA